MKRLIISILLALVPLWVLIAAYVIIDPFRTLRPGDPFFTPDDPMTVGWNKDFISTEAFNCHYESQHYDSYLFGASLSIGIKAEDWKRYIGEDARVFHYDASGETFYGILLKMRHIIASGEHIRNAILVIDPGMAERPVDSESHIFRMHPSLTDEPDWLQFQLVCFKAFVNSRFLSAYIDRYVRGLQPYMLEMGLLADEHFHYDGILNEENYPLLDAEVQADTAAYYEHRRAMFEDPEVYDTVVPNSIGAEKLACIREIVQILKREQTDYRVLFPPKYKQKYFCPSDKCKIVEAFGADHITDLSGDHPMGREKRNFYDVQSHPFPSTCRRELQIIYEGK